MTTYKGINGFAVQSVASDPSPLDEGQVWYNNATYAFKLAGIQAAAWASGGNLTNDRRDGGLGSVGTQTAGLVFGGEPVTGETEEYDGSAWTTSGPLNTARRYPGAFGTQVSTTAAGGNSSAGDSPTTAAESYNGTSWTSLTGINTSRQAAAGAGSTSPTGIIFGGGPGGTNVAATESWNGSSWTTVNSLNTARSALGGTGTQTSALAFGGLIPPYFSVTGATESWNGTSWTTGNSMNLNRGYVGSCGTETAALVAGGADGLTTRTATTESWNGTSWATTSSLATARAGFKGAGGTSISGLVAGGFNTGDLNSTEEFTGITVTTKTITTS